jgi:hypothetical protein
MGLVLISIGHIASTRELLGYQGWIRDPGSDAPKQSESGAPATLMMNAAAGFYGWLSDASLAPTLGNASLARWRPDIAADGGSLLRDSIEGGKGRLSTPSNGVSIVSAHYDPSFALKSGGSGAYAVLVSLKRPGYDKGAGFTMSASQARLIDGNTGSSVFPAEFAQAEQGAGDSLVRYRFSGDGSYLGSTASSEESLACLLFPATGLKRSKDGPLFLQIKGLRIQLPTPKTDAAEMARAVSSGAADLVGSLQLAPDPAQWSAMQAQAVANQLLDLATLLTAVARASQRSAAASAVRKGSAEAAEERRRRKEEDEKELAQYWATAHASSAEREPTAEGSSSAAE